VSGEDADHSHLLLKASPEESPQAAISRGQNGARRQ
jgi:hypothetical protein